MKIDLEHLHYWMQAIRESKDHMRTLDAFWRGQLRSKEWLVDTLVYHIYPERNKVLDFPVSVDVHGGWVGVLSSMLFQSAIPIKHIRSIDIDPECEDVARVMNKGEEVVGKFSAITADMCDIVSEADIVINTSCEHITQSQYDSWLEGLRDDSIIVLQSNNYRLPEHIRHADSLEHFKEQSHIAVEWAGEIDLPLYKRFMIIGKKHV